MDRQALRCVYCIVLRPQLWCILELWAGCGTEMSVFVLLLTSYKTSTGFGKQFPSEISYSKLVYVHFHFFVLLITLTIYRSKSVWTFSLQVNKQSVLDAAFRSETINRTSAGNVLKSICWVSLHVTPLTGNHQAFFYQSEARVTKHKTAVLGDSPAVQVYGPKIHMLFLLPLSLSQSSFMLFSGKLC